MTASFTGPSDPVDMLDLAFKYAKQGDAEHEQQWIAKASELAQRRESEALSALERLQYIDPSAVNVFQRYATALLQNGDEEELTIASSQWNGLMNHSAETDGHDERLSLHNQIEYLAKQRDSRLGSLESGGEYGTLELIADAIRQTTSRQTDTERLAKQSGMSSVSEIKYTHPLERAFRNDLAFAAYQAWTVLAESLHEDDGVHAHRFVIELVSGDGQCHTYRFTIVQNGYAFYLCQSPGEDLGLECNLNSSVNQDTIRTVIAQLASGDPSTVMTAEAFFQTARSRAWLVASTANGAPVIRTIQIRTFKSTPQMISVGRFNIPIHEGLIKAAGLRA